ncbi:MmgE/PrpD family protein [Muricoccus aerilatus]|uniref:MmgE/PrpD family protein n=1 Tax=Muricoccus aerilatus TaxID=452982 RepID=UPI0005C1EEAC|nr:MmgE/PrpD family protein [Roseomonas aerilata]
MDETMRRGATDPAGPTGRLATWLAELELEAVPEQVRERAKHVTLDGITCALVGAQLPWSRRAAGIVTGLESGGVTLIGHGTRTSPTAAALLNGTFVQGFELDDFHPLAPLHSASVVLPALLACAEHRGGMTGADLLRGALAGYEVGPRVGLALHGAQMLSRGWHSGAVFGTHAAAAAAGSLLRLDAARFEDALGLAATQSGGLMAAQYEAMSKRMHHGFAARAGLTAAFFAEGGYTGIKRVYEREYGGFLSTFGEGHDPDASQVAVALGERWETERIAIKPYAAMGGLIGPIDAVLALRERRPWRPEEVERIEVWLNHASYHHGGWKAERPLTEIGAQMNLAYAVSVAAIDGAALVDQFSAERMGRDDVWALIPRVEAHHDPAYDLRGPDGRGKSRMKVSFRDGQVEEIEINGPRGGLRRPLSNDEIVAKYRQLTGPIVEPARREAIERAVLGLETLGDAGALIALLGPPVGQALGRVLD